MTLYECLNVVVGLLTFSVLSWTLFVLRGYAKDTKTLAGVSVEQLPRPCVVLKRPPDHSMEAGIKGTAGSLAGDQDFSSPLIFTNVGTGPAVNCRYCVKDTGETRMVERWCKLPEIEPSSSFQSPDILNSLPEEGIVIIKYESVAGSAYRTDITIEGRRWVEKIRFTSPRSKEGSLLH